MEGDLQVIVGANLRRIRLARGYSQETLAHRIGWHRTFIGALERGERNVTFRTLERLCDQLEIEILDLFWDRARVGVTLADGAVLSLDPAVARPPAERRR